MSLRLLPCPFCGSTEINPYGNQGDYYFQCMTCTTTGPNGGDWESAELQWNTRHKESLLHAVNSCASVKRRPCLKCGRQFMTTPEARICARCGPQTAA